MKPPLIFEIKGNSLDDGPGIRSVIFFKGCPLSCVWCHNPEGMRTGVEIAFDARECIGCDTCLRTCTANALSRSNPAFIDRTRCTLCLLCADACPSGALSRVGRELTLDAILAQVLKDKPFYDTSGGGVTFSGGEPTLHMDFLAELLQALRPHGIHCLLETCGHFHRERFMQAIYPYLDAVYMDIKILDPAAHRRYCGRDNATILENFVHIHAQAVRDGKTCLPRVPLVPGITDTPENLGAIAAFLKAQGVHQARLLPYNPLWPEKSAKLGVTPTETNSQHWMPAEHLDHCAAIFRDQGVEV